MRDSIQIISASEVAEILGVSAIRVYEMARAGLLPAGVVVRLGRQVRFNADALDRWIESGGRSWESGWRRAAGAPGSEVTGDG